MKYRKKIAENFIKIRKDAGKSQRQFAKDLRISRQQLWRYENTINPFSVAVLFKAAELLNMETITPFFKGCRCKK